MDNQGRLADFFADYSPYREYDHVDMSNGYADVQNEQCIHYAFCTNCGRSENVAIQEVSTRDIYESL
ncbi:hypothetical protein [Caldalkalibacillus salinus]|uniref:hypothetical protein n=1 Tax=Caldalkalibacillus salinus TaxID=2803787 RepID=UPI0019216FCE|nr:hypothetical protein [Caldalkalibacillus salinus]